MIINIFGYIVSLHITKEYSQSKKADIKKYDKNTYNKRGILMFIPSKGSDILKLDDQEGNVIRITIKEYLTFYKKLLSHL